MGAAQIGEPQGATGVTPPLLERRGMRHTNTHCSFFAVDQGRVVCVYIMQALPEEPKKY